MDISKLSSKNAIAVLFAILVLVLYVDPSIVKSLNNNVLGRIVILVIIIFFASNDTTAGLLVVLIVISIMQMYYIKEGFESSTSTSTSKSTKPTSGSTSTSTSSGTVDVSTTDGSSSSSSTGSQQAQMDDLKAKIQAQMGGTTTSASTTSSKTKPTVESFYTADQLSVDPTRKQKASNSMLNAFMRSDEDNSQPHSEDIFRENSQLSFAPF